MSVDNFLILCSDQTNNPSVIKYYTKIILKQLRKITTRPETTYSILNNTKYTGFFGDDYI
jgi:hypothetical protein